jgi:2Fe-2S ferredoxin
MVGLVVTNRRGEERAIDAAEGLSVMEALRTGGFDEIEALCGGSCACATCHIYVDGDASAALDPMSDDENDLLDASSHRTARSRLSCQLTCAAKVAGLRITLAPEDQ